MKSLDDLAVILRSDTATHKTKQARITVLVEGPRGNVTENTYMIKYYPDGDYHWTVNSSPVT